MHIRILLPLESSFYDTYTLWRYPFRVIYSIELLVSPKKKIKENLKNIPYAITLTSWSRTSEGSSCMFRVNGIIVLASRASVHCTYCGLHWQKISQFAMILSTQFIVCILANTIDGMGRRLYVYSLARIDTTPKYDQKNQYQYTAQPLTGCRLWLYVHSSCHCRTQDMQYGIGITEGFNKPPLRLTLTMLRLLSFKAQGYKDFWNPSKILNPNGLSSQKVQFVLQSCLTQQKITDVKRLTNISDVRLLSKTFCCVEDVYKNVWLIPQKSQNWKFFINFFVCPIKQVFRKLPIQTTGSTGPGEV